MIDRNQDFIHRNDVIKRSTTNHKSRSVIEETSEADGEGPFEEAAMLWTAEDLIEGQLPLIRRQQRVPKKLRLEVLAILGVNQLEHRLVDDVRLKGERNLRK